MRDAAPDVKHRVAAPSGRDEIHIGQVGTDDERRRRERGGPPKAALGQGGSYEGMRERIHADGSLALVSTNAL